VICNCCGSSSLTFGEILWKELIDEWRLAAHEVAYINRQQGLCCSDCRVMLRSMALAAAIMRSFAYDGLFKDFVRTDSARMLQVLEINEAGGLTPYLRELPGHVLRTYPQIDMMAIDYPDNVFDLVVHSDTLEHVADPRRGLSECKRILKAGGYCAFTVPIIVDRLTCCRTGLAPSYHGPPGDPTAYLVHTEYGADLWKHVIQAGFQECRISSLEYPSAQALVGAKSAWSAGSLVVIENEEPHYFPSSSTCLTSLFLDTGADFNEGEVCRRTAKLSGPFCLTFKLGRPVAIKRLRWDPTELHICRVRLEQIVWSDEQGHVRPVDLALVESNGNRLPRHEFTFDNLDPMLFIPAHGTATSVSIQGHCTIMDSLASLGRAEAIMVRQAAELAACRRTLAELQNQASARQRVGDQISN
jgi:hypothetical protein